MFFRTTSTNDNTGVIGSLSDLKIEDTRIEDEHSTSISSEPEPVCRQGSHGEP